MALSEKIAPALSYFIVDLTNTIERELEKYDITLRQYLLLVNIYRDDGVQLNDLANKKAYKALFYRDINYLQKHRMLTKRRGRKYKKRIYLHLTAYGEVIVFELNDIISDFISVQYQDKRKMKSLVNFLNKYLGE